jgi:hypothetical protein
LTTSQNDKNAAKVQHIMCQMLALAGCWAAAAMGGGAFILNFILVIL